MNEIIGTKQSLVIDLWTRGFAHALAQLARIGQRAHALDLANREGFDRQKFITAGVNDDDVAILWPHYQEAA